VDLYHRFSSGLHYPRTVLLAANVPAGKHNAKVRLLAETRSKGTAVRIIRLGVN
jgi:hypothetical protein